MFWNRAATPTSTTRDGDLLVVGDKVMCDGYSAGGSGVVVERLRNDYVRVMWSDCKVPMTHRIHSLRRNSALEPWQRERQTADERAA